MNFRIGFSTGITFTLIILKAFGTIALPWIWVLAPIWVSALFFIGAFAVCFLLIGLSAWLDKS